MYLMFLQPPHVKIHDLEYLQQDDLFLHRQHPHNLMCHIQCKINTKINMNIMDNFNISDFKFIVDSFHLIYYNNINIALQYFSCVI